MADVREALRHGFEQARPPEDAFERLERERSRRRRRGRVGAAALALIVAGAGGGLLWTAFGARGSVGPAASKPPASTLPSSVDGSSSATHKVVQWDQVPAPPRGYGFDMSGWTGQGIARTVFAEGHHTPSEATAALADYTVTLKTQGWVAVWEAPVEEHGSLGDPGCFGGGRAFAKAGLRLWAFSGGCQDVLRFTVFRGPLQVVRLAPGQKEGTLIGPPEPVTGIEPDFALERAWEEMPEEQATGVTLTFGVSDVPATSLARGRAGWDADFEHVCQFVSEPMQIGPSPVGTSGSPRPSPRCVWGDAGVLLDGTNGAFVVSGFSSG